MQVLVASVCAGVCSMFFSKDDKVYNYVRLVSSLCVLCAVMLPLLNFFKKLPETEMFFDYKSDFSYSDNTDMLDAYIIENSRKNLEIQLKSKILSELGINADGVNIQFDVSENKDNIEVIVSSVKIYIKRADKEKAKYVKKYVDSVLYTDCEIELSEE